MGHLILLGDSILDNARYVPGQPCVVEQVRRFLPRDWKATLLAWDGSVIEDVREQLSAAPDDATRFVVSIGGNDALGEFSIVDEAAATVGEALFILEDLRSRFTAAYRPMLESVLEREVPTAVCTIYDAVPDLTGRERAALALFNEIILREAFKRGLAVVDLRIACDRASDFSHLSSIEPSMSGGLKIARAISEFALSGVPVTPRARVYI
jgi:hypothetical protein